jgi:lysophospholipase L1-like esterase
VSLFRLAEIRAKMILTLARVSSGRVFILFYSAAILLFLTSCARAKEYSSAPPSVSPVIANPIYTPDKPTPTQKSTDDPTMTPISTAPAPVKTAASTVITPVPSLWPIPSHQPSSEYTYESASGIKLNGYSCGDTIPDSSAAGDDYFSDAVFLGDSRTGNFLMFSGILSIDNADVFYATSATVYNVITEAQDKYGGYTLLKMISKKSYGKVYIMLGINEIGYPPSSYYAGYSTLIDAIKAKQPGAEIYIEAIIPVTKSRSDVDSVYNNENIQLFNSIIRKVCVEKGAHYVDTFTAFTDENGALPETASYDGIHLVKAYCPNWLNYIKTHTVVEVPVVKDVPVYVPPVPPNEEASIPSVNPEASATPLPSAAQTPSADTGTAASVVPSASPEISKTSPGSPMMSAIPSGSPAVSPIS